jgi:hypothetical protein
VTPGNLGGPEEVRRLVVGREGPAKNGEAHTEQPAQHQDCDVRRGEPAGRAGHGPGAQARPGASGAPARNSANSSASVRVRSSSRDSSHEKWITTARRNATATSRYTAGG